MQKLKNCCGNPKYLATSGKPHKFRDFHCAEPRPPKKLMFYCGLLLWFPSELLESHNFQKTHFKPQHFHKSWKPTFCCGFPVNFWKATSFRRPISNHNIFTKDCSLHFVVLPSELLESHNFQKTHFKLQHHHKRLKSAFCCGFPMNFWKATTFRSINCFHTGKKLKSRFTEISVELPKQ